MKDFAISDNEAVQRQLDRLADLPLPQGGLGLEKITAMCGLLGNPQLDLPPVFHVAGTNGKGSTCAFLRAMLEAEGLTVHTATKPHLVRYNERIRIAGELVSDAELARLLQEVLDACEALDEGLTPSFFEVTTAAMFLAFARHPADACVIEVGLGGRFDATNIIPAPAACGIAALGMDHEHFLLAPDPTAPTTSDPLARIGFEKAGIAKPGVSLVTQHFSGETGQQVAAVAMAKGALLCMRGDKWSAETNADGITYRDAWGTMTLPLPGMSGAYQADNAALAAAMLRHQNVVRVSEAAIAEGIRSARWPARLQRLGSGPLTGLLPDCDWLLDGGHNLLAAQLVAAHFAQGGSQRRYAIIGMLKDKDWRGFVEAIAPHVSALVAVPVSGHDHAPTDKLAESARQAGVDIVTTATDLPIAARWIAANCPTPAEVFVGGSLYLAGEVLKLNRELPE